MAKAKQSIGKIKKKHWFKVFSPKFFGEQLLGESYVTDKQNLIGKNMISNLMSLTGDMKKQSTNLSFKIVALKPEGAITDVIAYDMVPASIKRMVKRGNKAINESFIVKTKDNITIRIKPLVFTRTQSKGSVSTILRKAIKISLTKKIATIAYYDLINELVSHKIQKFLRDELNKIYPIKTSEIRSMKKIEGEVKTEIEEEAKPEEKAKPNEEKEAKPKKDKKIQEESEEDPEEDQESK